MRPSSHCKEGRQTNPWPRRSTAPFVATMVAPTTASLASPNATQTSVSCTLATRIRNPPSHSIRGPDFRRVSASPYTQSDDLSSFRGACGFFRRRARNRFGQTQARFRVPLAHSAGGPGMTTIVADMWRQSGSRKEKPSASRLRSSSSMHPATAHPWLWQRHENHPVRHGRCGTRYPSPRLDNRARRCCGNQPPLSSSAPTHHR